MIERLGTVFGIIGAFIVALGLGAIGYPVFVASSICLAISAKAQKNSNLFMLQIAFLSANMVGIYTYLVK